MQYLKMSAAPSTTPRIAKKQIKYRYVAAQQLTPDGYIPTKSSPDAVSFDVTLVARKDGRAEDVSFQLNEYVLNLSIKPPEGYYVEIHAKDLLYRQGYFILGGCVIIDRSHKGDIIIPLYKFENKPDLILPCQGLQLLVKKNVNTHIQTLSKTSQPSFTHQYAVPSSTVPSQSSSSSYYAPDVQHPASYASSKTSSSSSSTGFLW